MKKFLIGTLVAVAFVITANLALASYDFGTTTLKVGSKGPAVVALQTLVGATADGSFGPITKAKVVVWQKVHGLIADGLFGNMSKAKANGIGTNFSAGCTNASGFSTTTGLACSSLNANTFSAGCTNASGFSTTTGFACSSLNANTFPTGCTNASGFSITTGLSCSSLNAHTFPTGCTNASGFSTTTGFSCLTGLPHVIGGGSSGGGGHHATVESSDATLSATSTIKGFTPLNVGNLGTPNADIASAVAGSVIISTTQAADTTNLTDYVTLFIPTNTNATVTRIVKYATGASTTGFAGDTAYANEAITSQDFFIVKVTAQDSSVKYYKIIVGIENDASLISVVEQPITAGVQVGTQPSPKLATITVPNDISVLGLLDIQPVVFAHSFNLYSDNTFETEITGTNTMALAVGDTHAYIKVTAYDDLTTLYYDVTITRLPSSDATLNRVTSTIKGKTIDSLGTPNATLASAVAGSVIISTTQAADTTNLTSFITLFDKTNDEVTATKFVKYATGAPTTNFETDPAYNNEAITDQDFFIVKLTAGDGTILYYKIVVTVLVPTADVTYALTTPAEGGGNAIVVVQTAGAKTVDVAVVNGTTSVVITGTMLGTQTDVVGGADSGDVVVTGTSTTPIYTVDTSDVAAAGGEKEFTLTVSQINKTDIVYTVTVTVAAPGPVEITAFDAISNVSGGTTEVKTYANAAAVIADLNVSKATVTANTSAVTVPVTTWVDTDIYNSETAGSYTFTATLGVIPEGFSNTGNHTATVEVVVGAPLTPVTTETYTTVAANHIVTITLTGGTFKTGVIDTTDFTFTGTGNDWNAIAAATTFTRTNDTVVTITGIDGLLGAEDNIVAVLGEAQAIQATGVTAVASTPINKTSESFTTVTGDNNVTVTLTGGTFKADPIDAADFIFTGADELALEGATTFTRTNDTVVTITGLSALGGIDNTVTVLGEAQATQATSVAGASSLLLTNVTSGQYTTVTGNNDILITLTGGGTFKAGEIDQQDFIFQGDEDYMVIAAATSFTRASDTEVIIAGIGTLAGYTTNTITVFGATMATQATGVTVVASTVNVYAIGDIGPAGGLIVTRNGTSNNYLESAPANFHPGTKVWSSTADDLATSEAMGTGQTNTNTILASLGGQTSTATQFCAGLEIGANDWFLPSLDELNLMYTNLQVAGLGGFRGSNASYWSSSQFNISNASVVNFTDGTPGNSDKSANMGPYTRCVRAFHANESIVAPITATFAHNVAGDPIITVTALTNGAGVNMLGDFTTDNGTYFSYTLTNGGTPATVIKTGGSANLTIATPADASDAGAYTLTITRLGVGVGQWAIAVTVADDLQTVDAANGSTVSATTPASPTHAVNFTYTVTVKDNTTAHAFVSGLTAANFSEAAFDTGTQTPAIGTFGEDSVIEETSGVYTITTVFDTAHAGMDIETTVLGVKITDEITNVVVQ